MNVLSRKEQLELWRQQRQQKQQIPPASAAATSFSRRQTTSAATASKYQLKSQDKENQNPREARDKPITQQKPAAVAASRQGSLHVSRSSGSSKIMSTSSISAKQTVLGSSSVNVSSGPLQHDTTTASSTVSTVKPKARTFGQYLASQTPANTMLGSEYFEASALTTSLLTRRCAASAPDEEAQYSDSCGTKETADCDVLDQYLLDDNSEYCDLSQAVAAAGAAQHQHASEFAQSPPPRTPTRYNNQHDEEEECEIFIDGAHVQFTPKEGYASPEHGRREAPHQGHAQTTPASDHISFSVQFISPPSDGGEGDAVRTSPESLLTPQAAVKPMQPIIPLSPMEVTLLLDKIDSLEKQLKQTEEERDVYKRMYEEVVTRQQHQASVPFSPFRPKTASSALASPNFSPIVTQQSQQHVASAAAAVVTQQPILNRAATYPPRRPIQMRLDQFADDNPLNLSAISSIAEPTTAQQSVARVAEGGDEEEFDTDFLCELRRAAAAGPGR